MAKAKRPDSPAIGDAVVDGGVKYRAQGATLHALQLAHAGPSWRRTPIVALADPSRLEWDAVAGVWRGPVVEVAR